jgi:hypothetical protein
VTGGSTLDTHTTSSEQREHMPMCPDVSGCKPEASPPLGEVGSSLMSGFPIRLIPARAIFLNPTKEA